MDDNADIIRFLGGASLDVCGGESWVRDILKRACAGSDISIALMASTYTRLADEANAACRAISSGPLGEQYLTGYAAGLNIAAALLMHTKNAVVWHVVGEETHEGTRTDTGPPRQQAPSREE